VVIAGMEPPLSRALPEGKFAPAPFAAARSQRVGARAMLGTKGITDSKRGTRSRRWWRRAEDHCLLASNEIFTVERRK